MADLVAVAWEGDCVRYLDQRALPHAVRYENARATDDFVQAIATLAVRGAPCIGVFGAYGVALLRKTISNDEAFRAAAEKVRNARPTAVNLAWAVDRVLASANGTVQADIMLAEARAIHREQQETDAAIAAAGLALIPDNARIITHCHTGGVATAGEGTALGVILAAHRAGKKPHVFVRETRPLLQGARLTYFELQQAGVDATLLVDSAAAIAMDQQHIDLAIVGADRIASNGDTANKIGTYALAILAKHHALPFYVAAPRSTFDFSLASGAEIPIEERAADEVRAFAGAFAAPADAVVYNPAFDVTPAQLITAFITEDGIVQPPFGPSTSRLGRYARDDKDIVR